MNALKKLSFCALLSLGLFAQTAHAHLKEKDTINYPDWLKINLFDKKNPPNQYVGSASIFGKRNDFYTNYIPYDDQLPPEENAEKVAFLRARMNAYSTLESVLITKLRHRTVKALHVKNNVINHLFGLVDFLTSKSILAKRFVDTTNHRVYVMVQFPFIQPEDLIAYFKARHINLSSTSAKNLSAILNKALFHI
ncbi:hypothetical protein I6847_04825 [Helicobacter pylori]|uniref:hypothetical protein n=1 Tax=Helicobacter pylori TaxID=210 RepID=UPI0018D012F2|nr:hypothetical protein [Helicobacter pylori]MBH0277120.1 hypothetical protein [Helicobacter pylori]